MKDFLLRWDCTVSFRWICCTLRWWRCTFKPHWLQFAKLVFLSAFLHRRGSRMWPFLIPPLLGQPHSVFSGHKCMLVYFRVSIIHRSLTWATGSLTCVRDSSLCVLPTYLVPFASYRSYNMQLCMFLTVPIIMCDYVYYMCVFCHIVPLCCHSLSKVWFCFFVIFIGFKSPLGWEHK